MSDVDKNKYDDTDNLPMTSLDKTYQKNKLIGRLIYFFIDIIIFFFVLILIISLILKKKFIKVLTFFIKRALIVLLVYGIMYLIICIFGITIFYLSVKSPTLFIMFTYGVCLCIFIIGIINSISKRKNNVKMNNYISTLDFGVYGKSLPSDDQINYFREIPCNKDLVKAYWVAYFYDVVSTNTLREGIIGAILLKWIKDGLITVSKIKKGLFSFKDNNYAIDLNNISL